MDDIELSAAPLAAAITHYAAGSLDASLTAPAPRLPGAGRGALPRLAGRRSTAPAPLLPVNGTLLAVPVPGAATVALRFWPASFTSGLAVAAVAVVVMLALLLVPRWRKRRGSRQA